MLSPNKAIIATSIFLSLFLSITSYAEEKPPTFGSIEGYPIPVSEGGGAELDYCYRYSKRVWELVDGQPRTSAGLEKIVPVIKQALGAQGAREDIGEVEQYFSGAYKTREEMAGSRFYRCGVQLKLPIEERHKHNAELCFRSLNLPSYVAALRSSGRPASEVRSALKASNPAAAHPAIETTVRLVYSKNSESEVDALLKDTFLTCVIRVGENDVTQSGTPGF